MRRTTLASLASAALLATLAACSPDGGESTTSGATSNDDDGGGGADGGGSPGAGGDSSTPTSNGNGAGGPTASSSSGGGAGGPCAEGTIVCEGTTKRVCDGMGGFTDDEVCDPGVCVPAVGCTVCAPGSGTCEGNVSTVCKDDGSGFVTYICDPQQGSTCNAGTGHCDGACAPENLGTSYVGCDYFPTVAAQLEAFDTNVFHFAVAVSNTSDSPTNVLLTRGDTTVSTTPVAANSVGVIVLPWVFELFSATSSLMLADGAYRLRTTQPVTVYQYNPIEYSDGGGSFTYSNDASVLFPANAWGDDYMVAARNSWHFDLGGQGYPGFYSVVASQDATTVTLTPSATGGSIVAGGGVNGNGTGTVLLDQGDVLQVLSTQSGFNPDPFDLTGTRVVSDKPIQVISGHRCTYVPFNVQACDHLEESMPPVDTLALEYIVTPPLIPTGGNVPKAQMVRVIAVDAGTTITYDPPQPGAPTTLTNAGDYFEIPQTAADFVITGDRAILVAQYMQGQDAGGGSGDPAMALAVATEQYRSEYLFHAPTNYEFTYVNVTAPLDAVITIDGAPVSGLVPIGASGYGIVRMGLSNAGDGNHLALGDAPFGISVYGYGQYTSYWYPGGLDLDKLGTN